MKYFNWLHFWQRRNMVHTRQILLEAQMALDVRDYPLVEALVVPYLLKHTDDTAAYMLLGRAALEQEKWPDALAIFGEVIEHNPSEPWVWALLGYAALNAGKYAIALSALQRARNENPQNEAILEALLTIAQRIDSPSLRTSVEKDIQELQVPAT